MKSAIRYLTTLAVATAATLSPWAIAPSASAAQFGQQEINQDKVIAIAAPVNNGRAHQLLILEQVGNQRQCWQERANSTGPTVVDPLLLNFDFTGICNRSTDSNGYSIRTGGQDLGLQYRLSVVRQQNDLVLVAVPFGRSTPAFEIGRTNGLTTDFTKIELNPGWRLTRRVYNGQQLGHIYLTHDQDVNTLLASAPSTPRPTTPTRPTPSPTTPAPSPTTPAPSPTTPLPDVPNIGSRPPQTTPGLYYRVVVPSASPLIEARVKAIVPDAFRTTINGQAVMQAGLFNERNRADELIQRFRSQNIQANLLEQTGSIPTPPRQPTPVPPTQPAPPQNLPQVPRGRVVVVIDPGHGGRDPGAVGIGGLREKDAVFDMSRRVAQVLEQQGVTVIMTRSDDREVDLAPRVATAQRANANLFVSIHANAISMSRPDVNGLETYYYQTGAGLARAIHDSILRSTDMRDRGVRQANFYVIRNTSMPAVLVETGFVTGREDAARLSNPTSRTQIADAIARGILDYIQRSR